MFDSNFVLLTVIEIDHGISYEVGICLLDLGLPVDAGLLGEEAGDGHGLAEGHVVVDQDRQLTEGGTLGHEQHV